MVRSEEDPRPCVVTLLSLGAFVSCLVVMGARLSVPGLDGSLRSASPVPRGLECGLNVTDEPRRQAIEARRASRVWGGPVSVQLVRYAG